MPQVVKKQYVSKAGEWVEVPVGGGDFVNVAGDAMTGPLTLAADPTVGLEATTKQFVDKGIPVAIATARATTGPNGTEFDLPFDSLIVRGRPGYFSEIENGRFTCIEEGAYLHCIEYTLSWTGDGISIYGTNAVLTEPDSLIKATGWINGWTGPTRFFGGTKVSGSWASYAAAWHATSPYPSVVVTNVYVTACIMYLGN